MSNAERLRVLLVTNYFVPTNQGGAEVASFNTSRGLLEAGHEVRVLSINTRTPQPKNVEYQIDGVPVHEVNLARRRPNRYAQAFDPQVAGYVSAEIRRFKPDIIHTHNLSGTSLAPFAVAGLHRIPVVATLHDHWLLCANNMLYRQDRKTCELRACSYKDCFKEYDFWATIPGRRRVFSWLTRGVHTFISPSQSLIDLHVARGYDPTRFALVRLGMFPRTRTTEEAEGAIGEYHRGANTMVFVGAVVVTKGIEIVMQALPRLIEGIPDFRLLVAGWGPVQLQSLLREFGDSVVLLGTVPRHQIFEVFAGAGLTVMPSIYNDNSPVAVHESLAAGTPVLAARSGGIPELVDEGCTGYLYDANDPAELAAKAIAHFQRPAHERRAMRRMAVEHATREFGIEKHVSQIEAIYRNAIRDHQSPTHHGTRVGAIRGRI